VRVILKALIKGEDKRKARVLGFEARKKRGGGRGTGK
jgi:hypothetical protein